RPGTPGQNSSRPAQTPPVKPAPKVAPRVTPEETPVAEPTNPRVVATPEDDDLDVPDFLK
ncbi:MAG: cell division protein FtsZ, partial [Acidipropionibacterium jensenii]|nr:cell division protein FtsZ [Acidipropionibacterium jensenii]